MKDRARETSMRQAALTAGISILVMTVAAIIATDVALNRLILPDDAAGTLVNLQSSEILFRLGIFSWLVILICDVLAAWGLYVYFIPVNRGLSLLAAWFRLVNAALLGAAIFYLLLALQMVGADNHTAVAGSISPAQQVMFSLNAFNDTWSLSLVVFGFHILLIGYLILKSGYVPKILGVLLIIAFLGYMITNSFYLLLTDYENYKMIIELIFIIPMLSEVALGIWLVWKGACVQLSSS